MDARLPPPARTPPALLVIFACLIAAGALGAGGCANYPHTVERVDTTQFAGKWYEIAHYPQDYDHGCVATTTSYDPLSGDRAWVVRECREGSFTAPIKRVTGNAQVYGPENTRWSVQFPPGPAVEHWVLQLDPAYRYSVLGTPDRKGLWIMSRTPTMPPDEYDRVLRRLKDDKWDTARLRITPQLPDQLPANAQTELSE